MPASKAVYAVLLRATGLPVVTAKKLSIYSSVVTTSIIIIIIIISIIIIIIKNLYLQRSRINRLKENFEKKKAKEKKIEVVEKRKMLPYPPFANECGTALSCVNDPMNITSPKTQNTPSYCVSEQGEKRDTPVEKKCDASTLIPRPPLPHPVVTQIKGEENEKSFPLWWIRLGDNSCNNPSAATSTTSFPYSSSSCSPSKVTRDGTVAKLYPVDMNTLLDWYEEMTERQEQLTFFLLQVCCTLQSLCERCPSPPPSLPHFLSSSSSSASPSLSRPNSNNSSLSFAPSLSDLLHRSEALLKSSRATTFPHASLFSSSARPTSLLCFAKGRSPLPSNSVALIDSSSAQKRGSTPPLASTSCNEAKNSKPVGGIESSAGVSLVSTMLQGGAGGAPPHPADPLPRLQVVPAQGSVLTGSVVGRNLSHPAGQQGPPTMPSRMIGSSTGTAVVVGSTIVASATSATAASLRTATAGAVANTTTIARCRVPGDDFIRSPRVGATGVAVSRVVKREEKEALFENVPPSLRPASGSRSSLPADPTAVMPTTVTEGEVMMSEKKKEEEEEEHSSKKLVQEPSSIERNENTGETGNSKRIKMMPSPCSTSLLPTGSLVAQEKENDGEKEIFSSFLEHFAMAVGERWIQEAVKDALCWKEEAIRQRIVTAEIEQELRVSQDAYHDVLHFMCVLLNSAITTTSESSSSSPTSMSKSGRQKRKRREKKGPPPCVERSTPSTPVGQEVVMSGAGEEIEKRIVQCLHGTNLQEERMEGEEHSTDIVVITSEKGNDTTSTSMGTGTSSSKCCGSFNTQMERSKKKRGASLSPSSLPASADLPLSPSLPAPLLPTSSTAVVPSLDGGVTTPASSSPSSSTSSPLTTTDYPRGHEKLLKELLTCLKKKENDLMRNRTINSTLERLLSLEYAHQVKKAAKEEVGKAEKEEEKEEVSLLREKLRQLEGQIERLSSIQTMNISNSGKNGCGAIVATHPVTPATLSSLQAPNTSSSTMKDMEAKAKEREAVLEKRIKEIQQKLDRRNIEVLDKAQQITRLEEVITALQEESRARGVAFHTLKRQFEELELEKELSFLESGRHPPPPRGDEGERGMQGKGREGRNEGGSGARTGTTTTGVTVGVPDPVFTSTSVNNAITTGDLDEREIKLLQLQRGFLERKTRYDIESAQWKSREKVYLSSHRELSLQTVNLTKKLLLLEEVLQKVHERDRRKKKKKRMEDEKEAGEEDEEEEILRDNQVPRSQRLSTPSSSSGLRLSPPQGRRSGKRKLNDALKSVWNCAEEEKGENNNLSGEDEEGGGRLQDFSKRLRRGTRKYTVDDEGAAKERLRPSLQKREKVSERKGSEGEEEEEEEMKTWWEKEANWEREKKSLEERLSHMEEIHEAEKRKWRVMVHELQRKVGGALHSSTPTTSTPSSKLLSWMEKGGSNAGPHSTTTMTHNNNNNNTIISTRINVGEKWLSPQSITPLSPVSTYSCPSPSNHEEGVPSPCLDTDATTTSAGAAHHSKSLSSPPPLEVLLAPAVCEPEGEQGPLQSFISSGSHLSSTTCPTREGGGAAATALRGVNTENRYACVPTMDGARRGSSSGSSCRTALIGERDGEGPFGKEDVLEQCREWEEERRALHQAVKDAQDKYEKAAWELDQLRGGKISKKGVERYTVNSTLPANKSYRGVTAASSTSSRPVATTVVRPSTSKGRGDVKGIQLLLEATLLEKIALEERLAKLENKKKSQESEVEKA